MNAPLFILNLVATVVFLLLTLLAGRCGNRPRHYALAVLTIICLVLVIWQAELFGRGFVFNSTRLTTHLFFAISALIFLPGVALSGLALRKNECFRKLHVRLVCGFVALVGIAFATAVFMFMNATPIAAGD